MGYEVDTVYHMWWMTVYHMSFVIRKQNKHARGLVSWARFDLNRTDVTSLHSPLPREGKPGGICAARRVQLCWETKITWALCEQIDDPIEVVWRARELQTVRSRGRGAFAATRLLTLIKKKKKKNSRRTLSHI